MQWGVPRRHVISSKGEKKYKKLPPLPAFDAGRFIREYEDEVWATDVRLERLCLCELGGLEELADGGRVHKLRREVDSVALP